MQTSARHDDENDQHQQAQAKTDFAAIATPPSFRKIMTSGQWYDAGKSTCAIDRSRASRITRRFNCDFDLDDAGRLKLLQILLGAIGEGTSVSCGIKADYGYHVFMGKNSCFNYNCTFLGGAHITFGDNAWVGPNCTFVTPLHPFVGEQRRIRIDEDGTQHFWERNLPITVGNDVWIASNVMVNPGVNIGDGSVIGSGSIVTKDIPPKSLAWGNPCRVIRSITEEDRLFPD